MNVLTTHRSARKAMGIIEVMISLAICSSLLVAVAAAFKSSSDAINRNDEFFRCTQAGRVSLNQMLTEIRRADAVQVTGATAIDVIRPSPSRLPNEVHRTFTYDATNKRITLQIFYTGTPSSSPLYTLATNVASGTSFGPAEMGLDYDGVTPAAVRVPVTTVITAGNSTVTLCGAAALRRAVKF